MITVKVVADSIRWDCEPLKGAYQDRPGRITTVVMRYPRWIHSEFMTHRDRARNAASSRAISVKKSLENCKFRPKDIPSEQRGMSGGNTLSQGTKDEAYRLIDDLANYTLRGCEALIALGVHKSIINRYLEPFSYIEVVCTATRWDHFLSLRDHPEAEPHFQELASLIRLRLTESVPVPRDYHCPFVSSAELGSLGIASGSLGVEKCLKVSAARCAGISYQRPDFTIEKELEVCQTLITKCHSSPLEHPSISNGVPKTYRSGPMVGWKTLRNMLGQDT